MRGPIIDGDRNETMSFLEAACEPSVVRRALACAAVVGVILLAINHGDVILAGAVTPRHLFKMGLTFLVPYCVSTVSSVGALRGRR